MHYVYLIQSEKNGKFYIGSTVNIELRLTAHNGSRVTSTKLGIPWKLVYFEGYSNQSAALMREKRLKHHGKGLAELKLRLNA